MEPGSLEPRVAALENQVRKLVGRVQTGEQDAAAARVLAGAADRDVSEFRGDLREVRTATVAGLNALHEDSLDLRKHVNQGFSEMRGRFDIAAAGSSRLLTFFSRY